MQAGSSIMPAKVNPVIPEVVNQSCFQGIRQRRHHHLRRRGRSAAAERHGAGDWSGHVRIPEPDGKACISLREKCVEGITANPDICMNHVLNSIGIVTYLNPFIGHHEGDIVGKICAQTGKNVREVVLERGLLTAEQLDGSSPSRT